MIGQSTLYELKGDGNIVEINHFPDGFELNYLQGQFTDYVRNIYCELDMGKWENIKQIYFITCWEIK